MSKSCADFVPRRLEYRAKQAIRLLGDLPVGPLSNAQLRNHAGDVKQSKQGATYHNTYEPTVIREVREKLDPEHMKMVTNLVDGLPPIICFHVTKGGTGKTSLAVNTAVALAAQGYKVLLIDGDPQASVTEIMGIDSERTEDLRSLRDVMINGCRPEDAVVRVYENAHLDLMPADNLLNRLEKEINADRMREMRFHTLVHREMKNFLSQYEFVIIDTNPSSSTLNFNLMVASSMIVGVLSLDGLSIKALNTVANDLKDIESVLSRPVPMMLQANKFHAGFKHCLENYNHLKRHYGEVLSEVVVPVYTGFDRQVRLGDVKSNRPLFEVEPNNDACEMILDMSRSIIRRTVVDVQNPPAHEQLALA